MQSSNIYDNLGPPPAYENNVDRLPGYQRNRDSRCCCSWEKVAKIGIVLGSGLMLSTFLAFAITAFPVVAVLITGAVVLGVSAVALKILTSCASDSSRIDIDEDEDDEEADDDEIDGKHAAANAVEGDPAAIESRENIPEDTAVEGLPGQIIRRPPQLFELPEPTLMSPEVSQPNSMIQGPPSLSVLSALPQNSMASTPAQSLESQSKESTPKNEKENAANKVHQMKIIDTFDGAAKTTKAAELPTDVTAPLKISQLIDYYDHCWESGSNPCFNSENIAKIYHEGRIEGILEAYAKQFQQQINKQENFGFVEKRDLPKDSNVFVRADLHGDLKSLIENLKVLQNRGFLDENYKCKPDFHIMLLGDYVDRGNHCIKIFELMMLLKMGNPEQVHFIRGNHEYFDVNVLYGSAEFLQFIRHSDPVIAKKRVDLISELYNSMSLSTYMAETSENPKVKKKYKHFTHARFELTFDTSPLIDSLKNYEKMFVPLKRELSARVKKIAVDICPEKEDPTKFYQEKIDYKRKELKALQANKVGKETQIKEIELQVSALRVAQLAATELPQGSLTACNWGDIDSYTHPDYVRHTGFHVLSPEDVEHYQRLSSELNEVDVMFRGHEHGFKAWERGGKVIIHTLTIGMDAGPSYIQRIDRQPDRAYIMKTGENEWTKQALLRDPGSSITSITEPVPVSSNVF